MTDQDRVENGDGGRRIIKKPVLPSPEPAPTVKETEQEDKGDVEGTVKEESRVREVAVSKISEDREDNTHKQISLHTDCTPIMF